MSAPTHSRERFSQSWSSKCGVSIRWLDVDSVAKYGKNVDLLQAVDSDQLCVCVCVCKESNIVAHLYGTVFTILAWRVTHEILIILFQFTGSFDNIFCFVVNVREIRLS